MGQGKQNTSEKTGTSMSAPLSSIPESLAVTAWHWLDTARHDNKTFVVGYCSVDLPDATDKQIKAFDETMKAEVAAIPDMSFTMSAAEWLARVRKCTEKSLAKGAGYGLSHSSLEFKSGSYLNWQVETTYSKLLNPMAATVGGKGRSDLTVSAAETNGVGNAGMTFSNPWTDRVWFENRKE